jgi:hypothetical protein
MGLTAINQLKAALIAYQAHALVTNGGRPVNEWGSDEIKRLAHLTRMVDALHDAEAHEHDIEYRAKKAEPHVGGMTVDWI